LGKKERKKERKISLYMIEDQYTEADKILHQIFVIFTENKLFRQLKQPCKNTANATSSTQHLN